MRNKILGIFTIFMGATLATHSLAQSVPEDVQSDIDAWRSANGLCRGVSDPEVYGPACELREQLTERLNGKGYCGGETGWSPCVQESTIEVLAECGASKGQGYFFYDQLSFPEGPSWEDDAFTGGSIILIKEGEEWDIQFVDAIGAYGYREDGAQVSPLGNQNGKLTVGAFHPNYTDIYTFNFAGREVVWSSHKIGTHTKKVAVYRATCEGE